MQRIFSNVLSLTWRVILSETMRGAQGASLRTIMDRLGHTDVKSSLRYQAGDIEVVREAGRKLPQML